MEKVGVEAIVEGLASFLGDMKKMDTSIAGLEKPTGLLGRAFSGLGNIISGLVSGVFRVLEYTLGNLLASAIQSVISKIKELVSETIQAGVEFQILELRLKNLNFNAATESGLKFNEAMADATKKTQEQLVWLQKLAIQTPYDAQDLANVFTLARSYGFAADESQKLTQDISNFAAGMGLGNQEIERIIVNFGQMMQQGKVTGREMTDLARGAFVPVNDVLEIMRKKTGLTGDAFDEFRNSVEGVDAFMAAFSQLVKQRFSSAAEGMARTFKGATDNAKDFIKSVIGLNVIKPILDRVGGGLADFLAAFSETGRFEKITSIATDIGNTLSGIVGDIFAMGPSAEGMADKVVEAFQGISTWLDENREGIVSFFENIGNTIRDDVIPWIQDTLIPAFEKIGTWISENKPLIDEFGTALGNIGASLAEDFVLPEGDGGGFLQAVTDFMQFVVEHQESIATFIKILWNLFVVLTVINIIFSIAAGVVVFLIPVILFLVGAFQLIVGVGYLVWQVILLVVAVLSLIGAPILLLIGMLVLLAVIWANVGDQIKTIVSQIWAIVVHYFKKVYSDVSTTWSQLVAIAAFYWGRIKDKIKEKIDKVISDIIKWKNDLVKRVKEALEKVKAIDWKSVGKGIIDGIVGYVKEHIGELVSALTGGITSAISAAKDALKIESPSGVFQDIGKNVMEGFALGIKNSTDSATQAMQKAVGNVTMPAFGAPAMAFAGAMAPSSSVNSTTNYNNTLNVQTNARSEPLIADFNMLQSLSGR